MATTARNPSLRLSSRTSHFVLPKQWASMRKAEALERETGKRVIHFEKGDFQGEEFRPAPHIMEACAKAIADGHVRYVPGPGLPELRDAIAEEATKRGRPTVREEVLVTMGAKHALTQSLLTIVDQGDEVIFPNPGYPPDEFWITYAGGTVIYAPLVEPDFHFDLDSLQSLITPKTKMLIINSPAAAQRHDRRPAGGDRRDLRRAQRDRADRRDLQPHGLRAAPSTGRSPPSRGWPTARSWSTPSRRPTS